MIKLSAIAMAACIALQVPVHSALAAPVAASEQAVAARIDALLAPLFKADAPGATVIVVKDGKTVFRKAYGLADVAGKQLLKPDAQMRLGSITKQFTAVGILMLVEEGKLALSDDITRFFPDYPTGGKRITVEHLLTHTSGIVSYTGIPAFSGLANTDTSVAKAIDFFKNAPLEFEPGSRFAYSNSGYFLLGAIIEKVSGQPYADFIAKRIFIPLGMDNTAYEGHERNAVRRVTGYSMQSGKPEPSRPMSMSWPYSAGALVSTVDDMARWQAGLIGGKLIGAESLKRAFTPYVLSDGKPSPYGYGWFIGKFQGSPNIFHGGDIPGFKTDALWLPEEKVYVAVLGNRDAGPAPKASRLAAGAVLGKELPVPMTAKLDAKTLDSFVGVYRIDDKTDQMVRREDGQLSIQGTGRPRAPLLPYKTDGFLIGDSLIRVDFARDANGEVSRMTITDEDHVAVHERTAKAVAERPIVKVPVDVLDRYVGRYTLAPGMVLEIKRDGERLFGAPTGQRSLELFATTPDQFFVKEVDVQLRFETAPDGSAQMHFAQGPFKVTAKGER
jgi:CubicO group peptidase (beta-lactamase class C family)